MRRPSLFTASTSTGLFTVAVALTLAGPARADDAHTETASYTGRSCLGQSKFANDKIGLNGAGVLTANMDMTVVCPVPKTTSGPGITLDAIKQVKVNVTGNVACTLQVSSNYLVHNGANTWYTDTQVASGGVVTFGEVPFDDYWRATRTANDFLYTEVYCTMPMGTKLSGYSVVEHGYKQLTAGKGYAILPPSYCRPDSINKQGWFLNDSNDYLESNASGVVGPFAFDCPIPAGAGNFIQMTVGPPVGGNTPGGVPIQMGCNVNTDKSTTDSTWRGFTAPEFPVRELPTMSASQLVCQMTGTGQGGDGKILGYRTAYNANDFFILNGN